ncbi:large subunit ribosomal protein L13 [Methanohalophilus levihalophilus]|uniref:50S ribosomal protein L13 n=1 Tax=Methanohalophilus levihalophilus TaxID=1431282 RepID=UPI001AE4B644|nr:50S ribosomal protein L13 [Methanohalophilus levihalophilus]MBP2031140.1 large subunit ribosomal protein L13 [Methanohalophilus levihalophilus]
MTVINADGLIMGRLASTVAKRLLAGETIFIVNAENAIISGSKLTTFGDYKDKRTIGSKEWGPYFPKRPDRIVKRTVRGMLPYKKSRGRDAFGRLKVYVGVPDELQGKELTTLEEASIERLSTGKYMTVGTLSHKLGSKF